MPTYNVRHAECESVGEGDFVEIDTVDDPAGALARANPLFVYFAGDCDHWNGIQSETKRIKSVPPEGRPPDAADFRTVWIATVNNSPDYFYVYRVRERSPNDKVPHAG